MLSNRRLQIGGLATWVNVIGCLAADVYAGVHVNMIRRHLCCVRTHTERHCSSHQSRSKKHQTHTTL